MTRLSVVQYLNTTPLVYAFQKGKVSHDFIFSYDVPAECARKLRNGESDLGIIPSIEYARQEPQYRIVPEICVSSNGPVGSIFLFHRCPISQVRTVALDSSSRTSVALIHVIMKDRYGIDIEPISHPPDLSAMLDRADAALVIGDPALEYTFRPEDRLDLGEEWISMTGLPFVYAFWAGYQGSVSSSEIQKLIEAKQAGVRCLSDIAAEYAATHSHTTELYESYLRDHLQYPFGSHEQSGLQEFYRRAFRIGLIPAEPELLFFDK